MSTSYEYWVNQQLEPDNIIIRGYSKKRSRRGKIAHSIYDAEINLNDAEIREIEKRQDAYLAKHGIV